MKIAFHGVTIADSRSELNGQMVDLLIVDGAVVEIEKHRKGRLYDKDVEVKDCKGVFISPGWFDMKSNFREPGYEQKETMESGQEAAAQGGFTGVLLMPSVNPIIQKRSDVEFLLGKSKRKAVDVYIAGALTINREGKELAELYDMKLGGAVIFTDDKRAISNTGLLLRALQYADNIEAKVITYADDKSISGDAIANESVTTTRLGFKGSPSIAEGIALERDIRLAEYANTPLHCSGVSSSEAIEAIRTAKKIGLPITAEVYVTHLYFTDEILDTFDSIYKVRPPFRTASDRVQLREAILDGTIDCVVSDHSPEDIESKDVEFDYAAAGMVSLETTYSVLNTSLEGSLSPELVANLLSINPRAILGIHTPIFEIGAKANYTLFNPEAITEYTPNTFKSKSRNTPFLNASLKGKVMMAINGVVLSDNF
ncbi:MAG: dihydroorotase [Bacteroidota bacterium]